MRGAALATVPAAIVSPTVSRAPAAPVEAWFAVWTRNQYEPRVSDRLRRKRFEVFLPAVRVASRRRDKRVLLAQPLFPGYLFLRFAPSRAGYVAVASTDGVVRVLGDSWEALQPVPDEQVEAVRRLVTSAEGARAVPWIRVGDRVRIVSGALAGLEGLVREWCRGRATFVVNVDLLHRSVGVEIEAALHLVHADFCGAAAKLLFRRDMRLVTTKHGYDEKYLARHGLDTRFAHRDLYWAVAKASELAVDHSAVVSTGLRDLLVAFGIARPERVSVIPHGFDFSAVTYDTCGRKYRCAPRQLTVIGRLIPWKGHRFVLKVMPDLLRRFPDLCLVVVGRGALEGDLRAQVRALGIEEHVRFEGYQRNVHDYMRASDVVLVPSLAEGFGVVTLEAWHNRKPVVAFDVPALNEIVRDGETGYLVPPFDTGALRDRIVRLLEDPAAARRMGEGGYRTLQTDYSIDRMTDATIAMYQGVLRDVRRAA